MNANFSCDPMLMDAFREVGFPDKSLLLAIQTLKTIDVARQWVQILGARAFDSACIRAVPASGFDRAEYMRWLSAGFSPDDFPYLIPFMGTNLAFDDALEMLKSRRARCELCGDGPARELAEALANGLTPADVQGLLDRGFTAHQIAKWSGTEIEHANWREWITTGLWVATAKSFAAMNISPDIAAQWVAAGLTEQLAQEFIDEGIALARAIDWAKARVAATDVAEFGALGLSPSEAALYADKGIRPDQVARTTDGYVVELEPWQEDPIDHLPKVIVPGRISLSVWSVPTWSDEPLENEVSMSWDGERTIEWSVLSGCGLGMGSSVSFRGSAGWPNGADVHVSYSSSDVGVRGSEILKGAAPTAGLPGDAKEPQPWVDLAHRLTQIALEFDDMGGGSDDYKDSYYCPGDDEWVEFDSLFRIFLRGAGAVDDPPTFDSWLDTALQAGIYKIDDEAN